MKNWWLCIVFFSFLTIGIGREIYGQTTPIRDENSREDSPISRNKKVADSLYTLGLNFQDTQSYQKSLVALESSLKLYRLIGDGKRIGECFSKMAISYYYLGDYSRAIGSFDKGAVIFKRIGYEEGVATMLNNTGGVYNTIGRYLEALDSFRRAALLMEKTGDKKKLAVVTYNIGLIYSKGKDYTNAMKYFNQAYTVQKKMNDQKVVSQILNSMGEVYMKEGKYRESFNYLNQSLQVADAVKDKQLKMQTLSSLGELSYEQSNYKQALAYFKRCLTYSNEIGSLQYQSQSQIAIGNILRQLGRSKSAVMRCQDGLRLAEKLGALSEKKSGCDCLYQSYKALGNNQQALRYYEQTNAFEDSLNLAETSNKVMSMEFQKQQLVDSMAQVKKENAIQFKHNEEVRSREKQRNIIIISLCFVLLVAAGLWNRLNFVRKSRAALQTEKDRSETLLLNILPEEIAEELKAKGSVSARDYELVSILFTDFKSFTQTAETMSPQSLVEEINVCFEAFDLITEKYQIEKIKTIGDAYMAAGGIPNADENSLKNVVLAGLEMQAFMMKRASENHQANRPAFEMRLGIHAGPIVAGIVGVKKFQYDVWGDTVNTASRMESNGAVGKVNISETLYQLINNEAYFVFEHRGHINAKGKGDIAMYFVEKCSVAQVIA